MDIQERNERVEQVYGASGQGTEAFTRSALKAVAAMHRFGGVLWDLFMKLPEEERDRLDPDWREGYARWGEHQEGE